MMLPKSRGAFGTDVFEALRTDPAGLDPDALPGPEDAADAAITLWALYELSYRGFEDVEESAEWEPAVLAVRRRLEVDLERRLRDRWAGHRGADGPGAPATGAAAGWSERFFDFVAGHDGASLARHVQTRASREQVLDLLRMRSIYHLKESDPVAWVVPRLPAVSKAALMELQFDEYGGGDPNRLHHHLFAVGLDAVGLRSEYGAYVDDAPVEVLEQNNAMSLLGLHRRLRGAALGHLAAFETTSSVPSRQMVQGLGRLGLADEMAEYYREHVTADAVHEQLAVRTICASLVELEPRQSEEVFFGAFTCLDLEDRFARRVLEQWAADDADLEGEAS